MSTIRVIVVGVGPIGLSCARAIREQPGLTLTGLVDTDSTKLGHTIDELAGRPEAAANAAGGGSSEGVRVTDRVEHAIGDGADVAVVTSSSCFDQVAPTIHELLSHKLAVVSSCEQMLWPWYRHAALAHEVNEAAKQAGRAVLGTGVNPGFVMDLLTVVLSSMVRRVAAVRCMRRVDAALRRKPLQLKIGATLKPDQFHKLVRENKIGHRGLGESIALLGAGLGRSVEVNAVDETLEPVLADRPIPSAIGLIEPGYVAGIHNCARWADDDLTLSLDLSMAVGLENPIDKISIEGPVPLCIKIPGGVPGDSATVGAMLNHIRIVHRARGGLLTMLDVPPAGCHGRDA